MIQFTQSKNIFKEGFIKTKAPALKVQTGSKTNWDCLCGLLYVIRIWIICKYKNLYIFLDLGS